MQASLSPGRSRMGEMGWVVVGSRPERSQGVPAQAFGQQYTFPPKSRMLGAGYKARAG